MQTKKGLSDVVSTVLIILLVVAAIAIIGAIVLNVVNRAGTDVDFTVACQSVDIQASTCIANTTHVNGTFVISSVGTDVTVKRVMASFRSAAGVSLKNVNTTTIPATNVPGNFTNVDAASAKTMAVAVQLNDFDDFCSASTPVTCTEA